MAVYMAERIVPGITPKQLADAPRAAIATSKQFHVVEPILSDFPRVWVKGHSMSKPMKRTLWILLLLSATRLFAQPAGVSISLVKQGSSTQNVGQAVVLTAKVRTPGIAVQPFPPVPGSGVLYETDRLRFTFKAHRSWPLCAAGSKTFEEVVAAGSESTAAYVTHIAHYPWYTSAADAGEYTFSVDVTYVQRGGRQWMGTASTSAKTTLTPTEPWVGHVKTTFYPPSPSPAPVNLTLSASVLYGGEFMWYRYKYTCGGFNPPTQTKEGVSVSFQMQIPNPGSYIIPMTVDKVQQVPGQSGCIWQARIEMPHTDPAYYYATAP